MKPSLTVSTNSKPSEPVESADPKQNSLYPLAEMLFAAYLTYNMGNVSVDNVLKSYVRADDKPVGSYWLAVAERIQTDNAR